MDDTDFPLILLKPVADDRDNWVAVEICGLLDASPANVGAVQKLFTEHELATAIPNLTLRLPSDLAAAIDPASLPEGVKVEANTAPVTARPPVTSSGPASTVLLKLLGQLTSDAETRDIEATLKRDPQLSVQLLRLVNSVAFSPTARISSFSQAINLLGRRQLQRWLQLLLFANKREPGHGNPLLARAALRAALMENIIKAKGGNKEGQDEAFMIGMFSLLEQLFGQALDSIIKPLQLADEVNGALLQHAGPLGHLLALVETAESQPAESAAQALALTGISTDLWCKAQIAALQWTLQVIKDA